MNNKVIINAIENIEKEGIVSPKLQLQDINGEIHTFDTYDSIKNGLELAKTGKKFTIGLINGKYSDEDDRTNMFYFKYEELIIDNLVDISVLMDVESP